MGKGSSITGRRASRQHAGLLLTWLLLTLLALSQAALASRVVNSMFFVGAGVTQNNLVTYTLTGDHTNGQPSNCDATLTIPPGLTFESSSFSGNVGNGGSQSVIQSGGNTVWRLTHWHNIGVSVSITLRIDPNNPPTSQPTLTASTSCGLASTFVPLTNPPSLVPAMTTPPPVPDLTIDKTLLQPSPAAGPVLVKPGDVLVYEIEITNVGNAPATGVTVTDNLSGNVDYVSSAGGVSSSFSDPTVTWQLDDIPANQSRVLKLNVVASGASGTIDNSAVVQSNETGPRSDPASTVTIAPQPNLTLGKSASNVHITAGDEVTYALRVTNTGAATATGVILTDPIPPGMTFVGATAQPSSVSPTSVSWSLPDLPQGTPTATVHVTLRSSPGAAVGEQYVNQATITSDQTGIEPSNEVTVEVVAASANITMTKTVDKVTARSGDRLTYTIAFRNDGQGTATNVVLTDLLPSGVTFVDAEGNYSQVGDEIIWDIGTMAPGQPLSRWLTVDIDNTTQSGNLANTASIRYSGGNYNDRATASADTSLTATPILEVTKVVDRQFAEAGDLLTYTITYRNIGPVDATNVQIIDTLSGLVDIPGTVAGATVDMAQRQVTWDLGTLRSGAQNTKILQVPVAAGAITGDLVVNTALIQADNANSDVTAEVTGIRNQPALTLTNNASTATARPGQEIAFALYYENTGTATATSPVLTAVIPGNTTLVSLPAGASQTGNTLTWTLPRDVTPGGDGTEILRLRVNAGTPDGATVSVPASITATNQPTPADATATVAIVREELAVAQTVSASNAQPGQALTYTLNFWNFGHATATGSQLSWQLPQFATLDTASGSYTQSGGLVTWDIGNLPSQGKGTFTVRVKLDATIANGTILSSPLSLRSDFSQVPGNTALVTIQSAPVLSVDKTVDKTTASPGETVTYTISYANTGNDIAADVVLLDRFPAELTFVGATPGLSYDAGTGEITSQPFDLAPGAPRTAQIFARVPAGTPNLASILNIVEMGETVPPSTAFQHSVSDTATLTISSLPRVTLLKELVTPNPSAGDTLRYHITITNTGTADATGLSLQDVLPQELTYRNLSISQPPSVSGNTLNWNLQTLAPGKKLVLEYQATVASPLADGTLLTNTATLRGTNIATLSSRVDTVVSSAPAFSFDKTAQVSAVRPGPPGGAPGGTIIYTLTYENVGTTEATGVVIKDVLPTGVTFVSATGSPSMTSSLLGTELSWNVGTVPPSGRSSFDITVQAASIDVLPEGSILNNFAGIDSNETPPQIDDLDITVTALPVLAVSKTSSAGGQVSAGGAISYTIEYSNVSTVNADAVLLADFLPDATAFTLDSVTTPAGAVLNTLGDVLVWELGPVAAGQTGQITVNGTVASPIADGTSLFNGVAVAGFETTAYNVIETPSVFASTLDTVSSSPVLNVQKRPKKSVVPADGEVVYSIEYSNTGSDTATGVELADLLDPGLAFVSATGNPSHGGGLVQWSLPDLAPGASGTLELRARVLSPVANGSKLYNTVGIDSLETTPVIAPPVLITANSAPDLSVSKVASNGTVPAGGTIDYTITYLNEGTDDATNVTIEDHLPTGAAFVAAPVTGSVTADTSGAGPNGGIVRWSVGTLGAGQSGTLLLQVTAPDPVADGTILHNSLSIDSATTPALTAPVTDVRVTSSPVLTLSKSGSASLVSPGTDLTYTLVYENTGSDQATGVVLRDTLPANVSVVSVGQGGSAAGGVVTWNPGAVAANSGGTVTVVVRLPGSLANGSTLVNAAELASNELAPVTATQVTTVSSAPVLTLTETVASLAGHVAAGAEVTYSLTYTNTGTDVATGLTLVDQFPANAIPVSIGNAGSFDANNAQAVWHLSSLAPGQPVTVQYTLRVPLGLPTGSSWDTTSSISAANAATATAGTSLIVDSQPVMALTKTGSNSVEAGQTATYRIEYFNSGNGVARNVQIVDVIPPGWSLESASSGGTEQGGGLVLWNIGDVAPGSGSFVTLTLRTPVGLPDGQVATNTALIGGDNFQPLVSSATTVERSHVELVVTITPSLTPAPAGSQITYTVTYQNIGNADALNAELGALIPANTQYVTGSATGSGGLSGDFVLWSLGTVPAGGSDSFTFAVDVASVINNGTPLPTLAAMIADNAQPATAVATTYAASAPVLITSKSVDQQNPTPGATVTYSITVANVGTQNASNITVSDNLPAALQVLDAQPNATVDTSANSVTWTIPTLDVGASPVTLRVRARVLAANSTIVNRATVSTGVGLSVQLARPSANITSGAPRPVPVLGEQQRWILVLLLMLAGGWELQRRNRRRRV